MTEIIKLLNSCPVFLDHLIIEGYNYDIFISYRQKDNKGDRWVSEFVEALKTELESTFKEEISVYFDINPHDGLLETHDVNESLKEKLKCLVFIPIISRTYCDPKSFAWEHEFKAFVEQASKDQYGLKIKLPGGNVANRVLPVQIHDLDSEDIRQCESVLGSVLRGIEFIYKESGIDKPLAPDDDENKNLNKTKYRIQIVKVAHAIKEIITAIEHYKPYQEEVPHEVFKPASMPQKNKKTPIIVGSVIALALIILGILFIPKLFKPSEQLEKSIAVLPFKNDSPDQERMYFINGTMEAILDNLCKIKDLRVPGRTSVEQYRDNIKPIPTIAKELNVSYILEGSGHRDGNKVRLFVQLLDGKKDQHLWSKSYDADIEDIFSMQSEIAKLIAREINAIITPEEKQRIEAVPTKSLTAYDFFQRGREEIWKYYQDIYNSEALANAKSNYGKALEYDSSFALAFAGLAELYYEQYDRSGGLSEGYLDSAFLFANQALSYDPQLALAHSIKGSYYYAKADIERASEAFERAIELNPNDYQVYFSQGRMLIYTDANSIINLHKAASLCSGSELVAVYYWLFYAYMMGGFHEQASYYADETFKLNSDSIRYYINLAWIEGARGNYDKAIELSYKGYEIDPDDQEILYMLFYNLSFNDQNEEALKYAREWIDKAEIVGVSDYNSMHRIGYVLWQNGFRDEAEDYFNRQIEYCNTQIEDEQLREYIGNNYYDLAAIYAFLGEKEKALENLRILNNKIPWSMLVSWMQKGEPLFDGIRDDPEFQQILNEYKTRFQADHERIKKLLEEQGML